MGWRRSVTCRSHRQGPHSWRWPKPEFEARTFLGFLFVFLFSLGGEGSGSEGGTTRDVHLAQRRGPRGFPPTLPAGRTSGPRARAPETPPARREPPSKRRRDWASGGGPGRVRGVGYVARRAGAWKRPGARWGEWNGRWRREFGAPRLLGPRGLGPPPGPRGPASRRWAWLWGAPKPARGAPVALRGGTGSARLVLSKLGYSLLSRYYVAAPASNALASLAHCLDSSPATQGVVSPVLQLWKWTKVYD